MASNHLRNGLLKVIQKTYLKKCTTDNEGQFILFKKDDQINYDVIGIFSKIKMAVIEPVFCNDTALQCMDDGNRLSHNDNECRHHTIIFVKVVNDAAP